MQRRLTETIKGLVFGLLILLYQERRHYKEKVENRISAFVDSFRQLYKGGGFQLEVLIPAGIASLHNNKEIQEAFNLLIKYIPVHPLRKWKPRVEKIGYKKFFNFVVESKKELNKKSIEEFLQHLENSSGK